MGKVPIGPEGERKGKTFQRCCGQGGNAGEGREEAGEAAWGQEAVAGDHNIEKGLVKMDGVPQLAYLLFPSHYLSCWSFSTCGRGVFVAEKTVFNKPHVLVIKGATPKERVRLPPRPCARWSADAPSLADSTATEFDARGDLIKRSRGAFCNVFCILVTSA